MIYFEEIIFCPDEGNTAVIVPYDYEVSRRYSIVTSEVNKFRKPNPGMINLVLADNKDCSEILFIGDMESDKLAAKNANIPFIWADDWLV